MDIALVHDYLNQYGGAERVLEALHDIYPSAPVYTSIYAPNHMPSFYRQWKIRTSFMQRMPAVAHRHQMYLPLYPLAFEQFNLSQYKVVLSSSSAFAKGVITDVNTLHICYCHTPMRFVWNYRNYIAGENLSKLARIVLPAVLNYVRLWDEISAQRVDAYIANSQVVARRIRKRYGREATVINPPVNTKLYHPEAGGRHGDYFLVVSRMIPYKRLDVAIDAFSKLNLPLKVVGKGRQETLLRARAGSNIQFAGPVPDAELKKLYANCRAFIFPGEEDFGITPLEAQASGRPVIAYGAGGALETVVPGRTGEFFPEQTPAALAEVIRRFNDDDYDPAVIRRHAESFDVEVFKRRIAEFVQHTLAEAGQGPHKVVNRDFAWLDAHQHARR
jgi:glycosyltransferase involved in cell wall biosynthesis